MLAVLMMAGVLQAGMASQPALADSGQAPATQSQPAVAAKPLVAVAGFENKSTYSADRIWETSAEFLTAALMNVPEFRVVEWARMKVLFDRDELSVSDLVAKPDKREKAQKILLCEYFVSGAVTRYNVAEAGRTSSMSKNRTFNTTIRVDVTMVDARSGEYVGMGTGEASETQTFKGGQLGTWNSAAADRALDRAIAQAVSKLVVQFKNR